MQKAIVRLAPLLPLFALASYCCAQSIRSGNIPVDWTQARIQDTGEVLNVVLNQAEGMDWMVGVKVKAEAENTISVGDGTRGLMFQRSRVNLRPNPRLLATLRIR